MKLIGDGECYSEMPSVEYGHDAYGNPVDLPNGYELISKHNNLKQRDIPFDVYAGWLSEAFFNSKYHFTATSKGRWTAWARRNEE